jgi:hypothetical protein
MVSYFYLMIASDPCFASLGPSLLRNSIMVAWPDSVLGSGRGGLVGHIKAETLQHGPEQAEVNGKPRPHFDPEPDR